MLRAQVDLAGPHWRSHARSAATVAVGTMLAGLTGVPAAHAVALPYQDASQPVETRVADLLSRMSLDDKVGQMTQSERGVTATSDMTTYRIRALT